MEVKVTDYELYQKGLLGRLYKLRGIQSTCSSSTVNEMTLTLEEASQIGLIYPTGGNDDE
jgi:hypothetical protein